MGKIVPLQKFKEGKSTLAEMYEEITEGVFPFINFQVWSKNGNLVMHVPIPWARFREDTENPNIWEVRSTDCDPTCECCNHTHIFITKAQMKSFIYSGSKNIAHYQFSLTTD
jgi:hypothetical protein